MLRTGHKIIDAHCHAEKDDRLTGPWETAAPLDKYLARTAQAGISHTLFGAFHSHYATKLIEPMRRNNLYQFDC